MAEVKEKKKGYITQLQEENAELKKMVEETMELVRKQQVPMVVVAESIPDPNEEDDTMDIVDAVYGRNKGQLVHEELPKREAVRRIVNYYRQDFIKAVPSRDSMRNNRPVNRATIYAKIKCFDRATGDELNYYKDMPLNLACEMQLNPDVSGLLSFEIVPKSEWLAYEAKRNAEEAAWNAPLQRTKVEKAINTLASIA